MSDVHYAEVIYYRAQTPGSYARYAPLTFLSLVLLSAAAAAAGLTGRLFGLHSAAASAADLGALFFLGMAPFLFGLSSGISRNAANAELACSGTSFGLHSAAAALGTRFFLRNALFHSGL